MPTVKISFGGRILITSQALRDEMVRDRALEIIMMQHAECLDEPSIETVNGLKGQLSYYREQIKLTMTSADKRLYY